MKEVFARRATVAVVAAIVIVGGAVATLWLTRPAPWLTRPAPHPAAIKPLPSPSPSPSPSPALPSTFTAQFTVTGSCPQDWRLTFRDQDVTHDHIRVGLIGPRWVDVTGDGIDELLVTTVCSLQLMIVPGRYAVLALQADGTLLEIAELPGKLIWAHGGVVHMDDSGPWGIHAPGRTAILAWNGSAFVRSSFGGYPAISDPDRTEGHIRAWITLRGSDYYLMDVENRSQLRMFAWTGTVWRIVATVPLPPGSEYYGAEAEGDRLTLFGPSNTTAEFSWNGKEFVAR